MILLGYELADNPGYEYEKEFGDTEKALQYLSTLPEHMIVWYEISENSVQEGDLCTVE